MLPEPRDHKTVAATQRQESSARFAAASSPHLRSAVPSTIPSCPPRCLAARPAADIPINRRARCCQRCRPLSPHNSSNRASFPDTQPRHTTSRASLRPPPWSTDSSTSALRFASETPQSDWPPSPPLAPSLPAKNISAHRPDQPHPPKGRSPRTLRAAIAAIAAAPRKALCRKRRTLRRLRLSAALRRRSRSNETPSSPSTSRSAPTGPAWILL